MAGSFGYTRDHYDVSCAIGERKLLPAARAMTRTSVLVAAGTSCRHQVADLAGVTRGAPGGVVAIAARGDPMNLAWISLAALILAITLSMVTSVNVGVVSLAMAWIVGVYMGGMPLAKVIGTFPIDLLLNLVGVTLLFGMANNNGTLGRIAARAVRACQGNAGVIPIMFFFIAVDAVEHRARQHRHDRDHGADGDGGGDARRRFRRS